MIAILSDSIRKLMHQKCENYWLKRRSNEYIVIPILKRIFFINIFRAKLCNYKMKSWALKIKFAVKNTCFFTMKKCFLWHLKQMAQEWTRIKKNRVNTCRWTNKNQLNVLICETLTANGRTKKISQKFSILQTWCVCSAQVWWLFSLLHQMHTYFLFFKVYFRYSTLAAGCSGIPSITEKCVPHVQATFRCTECMRYNAFYLFIFVLANCENHLIEARTLFDPFSWRIRCQKKRHSTQHWTKEKNTKMIIMHLLRCSETH